MKYHRLTALNAALFVALPVFVIGMFVVLPSLVSMALSFCHYEGVTGSPPRFVYLSNFRRLLLFEPLFWGTFRNTLIFAFTVVPCTVIAGFLLALATSARWFRGGGLVRMLYFLPNVVSIVAVGFVWQWIFNPSFGLLNGVLGMVGVPPQPWLGSPRLALPCIIAIAIWYGLGFSVIIYNAALHSIPRDYYEAASLDGADSWRQVLHITWPLVMPTTFFLLITGLIGAFQVFDLVYIMTGGGPANSTNVLNNLLYRKFLDNELGYAASISMVIFAITLAVTLLQFRIFRKTVN